MPVLPRSILILTMLAASVVAAQGDDDLVHYDFDREPVQTGPWLSVWENARGSVSLSATYPFSGYHSVEIVDVAGDGEFPELQGFLPLIDRGRVRMQFAFMTATPQEELNVAVAGPAHFFLRNNGMAFWLTVRDGVLRHMSDREWHELLPLDAFTWYTVDVVYDVEDGAYDLTVAREDREEPLVVLENQTNAVGIPGSQVRKFSFVGAEPGKDDSNVVFYVDDIVFRADRSATPGPFVAPGRRMLFVDLYDHYKRRFFERPACPPMLDYGDFGLSDDDLRRLAAAGHAALVQALAEQPPPLAAVPDDLPTYLHDALHSIRLWRLGCSAPAGSPGVARDALFARAAATTPGGPIYAMSRVLGLVAEGRFDEADALFVSIYADWQDDPRFPAISATIGIARGDLDEAEAWLRSAADLPAEGWDHPFVRELLAGQPDRGLVTRLQAVFPEGWSDLVEAALVLEQRYYVLLWQGDLAAARSYAGRVARRFIRSGLPEGRWIEREGDAAFHAGDFAGALELYQASLEIEPAAGRTLLRLSDVYFKLGDVDRERTYREKVYGTLERKDDRPHAPTRAVQCSPGPADAGGRLSDPGDQR